jgi:hypothetical protein
MLGTLRAFLARSLIKEEGPISTLRDLPEEVEPWFSTGGKERLVLPVLVVPILRPWAGPRFAAPGKIVAVGAVAAAVGLAAAVTLAANPAAVRAAFLLSPIHQVMFFSNMTTPAAALV